MCTSANYHHSSPMRWLDPVIWWCRGGLRWSCQCLGRLALTRWRRDCGYYEVLGPDIMPPRDSQSEALRQPLVLFPSILLQLKPLLLASYHRSPIWQFVRHCCRMNPAHVSHISNTLSKAYENTKMAKAAMFACLPCYVTTSFDLSLLCYGIWPGILAEVTAHDRGSVKEPQQ